MTYPDHQGETGLLHRGRKLNSVWNARDSMGHLLELTPPVVKVNGKGELPKRAGQLRIQEWRFESYLQAKSPKQLKSGLRREISKWGRKSPYTQAQPVSHYRKEFSLLATSTGLCVEAIFSSLSLHFILYKIKVVGR